MLLCTNVISESIEFISIINCLFMTDFVQKFEEKKTTFSSAENLTPINMHNINSNNKNSNYIMKQKRSSNYRS